MNAAKFESLQRGLSIQARKVYNAIPILESWTPAQIMQELHRLGASMNDIRVVSGCINSLIDSGLVTESSKGYFVRIEIRQKKAPKVPCLVSVKPKEENTMPTNAAIPLTILKEEKPVNVAVTGPIEKLSTFASRLRALADDMETVALELSTAAELNSASAAKLHQLQALLKSL